MCYIQRRRPADRQPPTAISRIYAGRETLLAGDREESTRTVPRRKPVSLLADAVYMTRGERGGRGVQGESRGLDTSCRIYAYTEKGSRLAYINHTTLHYTTLYYTS